MADVTPFMKRAYNFFIQKGYSPHAAAALAGQAQWESSGSPTIQDPRGEGSIGLFQWRLDRRTGLNDFAKARGLDPTAENTQLEYSDWELNNTERGYGDMLRGARDGTEANRAVISYLRPAGWTRDNPQAGHAWSNRVALSNAINPDGGRYDVAAAEPTSAPAPVAQQPTAASPAPAPEMAPSAPLMPVQQPDDPWKSLINNGMALAQLGQPSMGESGLIASAAPAPSQITPGEAVSMLDLVFPNRRKNSPFARG